MAETIKHTPGPWHTYLSGRAEMNNLQWLVIGVEDDSGDAPLICEANQGETDARLIGAAPDLYKLAQEAWGALNFILAFYEPQNYLDTNAWKNAEASGRRVHAALRARLDELSNDAG